MKKFFGFINHLVEMAALNASKNWQEWEAAYEKVMTEVRSFGLDAEAMKYFALRLADRSGDAGLKVQVCIWGISDERPTRSIGNGGRYRFSEAGNAWFDENLQQEEFIETGTNRWVSEDYVQFDVVLKNPGRVALKVSDDFLSDHGSRLTQAETRQVVRAELKRTQAPEHTREQKELLARALEPLRRLGVVTPGVISELLVAVGQRVSADKALAGRS